MTPNVDDNIKSSNNQTNNDSPKNEKIKDSTYSSKSTYKKKQQVLSDTKKSNNINIDTYNNKKDDAKMKDISDINNIYKNAYSYKSEKDKDIINNEVKASNNQSVTTIQKKSRFTEIPMKNEENIVNSEKTIISINKDTPKPTTVIKHEYNTSNNNINKTNDENLKIINEDGKKKIIIVKDRKNPDVKINKK
jgi:hypothetical protein